MRMTKFKGIIIFYFLVWWRPETWVIWTVKTSMEVFFFVFDEGLTICKSVY